MMSGDEKEESLTSEPSDGDGAQASDAFQWGDGYVGGRGYGGTNYDLSHGYRLGTPRHENKNVSQHAAGGTGTQAPTESTTKGAPRGGYEWGEEYRAHVEQEHTDEQFGPSRYGHGPYHERLRRQRRSDSEILKDVEDTLFYDTWVDADAIKVSVENGIVRLGGTLVSYEEVRYATDDAWEVEGVRGVRSELEVNESRGAAGSTA
jgi:hypothetical protein